MKGERSFTLEVRGKKNLSTLGGWKTRFFARSTVKQALSHILIGTVEQAQSRVFKGKIL
jgi:hypothetical protein